MSYINYSIIIPHKNIPKLLQRCLDSIPQRADLEVIVVDDNSDPNIVNFEKFPGFDRKDTTIIFDKSGKGAGRARNIGLQHAQGKWLLFADADDYFNYCIRDILDEYREDVAEIVFFSASSVDSLTYTNVNRADYVNDFIDYYLNNPNEGENILRYVHAAPWAKLVKSQLIRNNDIRFQETIINNDVRFSYRIGYHAKNLKVDKRALYCLTYRGNSIQYSISEEKILESMNVLGEREGFLIEHGIQVSSAFVWGGKEYIARLADFWESNNLDLYNRCLKILSSYNVPLRQTEVLVKEELKYRRSLRGENWLSNIRRRLAIRTKLRSLLKG
ncbi:MAG: glycosyltransferase family 2 protein [Bacteroidales bacterium]|nr:glycosyltransferase family 2 protein [Bacteroidales bacterium]